MIEIPVWIQAFVLAGIGVVIFLVPIRILYELTKDSRDRSKKMEDLAGRLKERFGAVRFSRGLFGPHRIHFTHEERPGTVFSPAPDQIAIRLEPKVVPRFHALVRTKGRLETSFTLMPESMRIVRRIRTGDPLIDESLAIYATPVFGSYLRELIEAGISTGEKPEGLVESLVVLRRMPGIRRFEFRMSPAGGFRITFTLRADDLLYRPDELETAVHHAFRLYDLLVLQ